MKRFYYLLLALFIMGCTNEIEIPKEVLPKEKMVDIMTDAQIAESYIKLKYAVHKDSIESSDSIYNAIYRKHQISKAQYDTSFNFYQKHPELIRGIFDEVITKLSGIQAKSEAKRIIKGKKELKKAEALPENPIESDSTAAVAP